MFRYCTIGSAEPQFLGKEKQARFSVLVFWLEALEKLLQEEGYQVEYGTQFMVQITGFLQAETANIFRTEDWREGCLRRKRSINLHSDPLHSLLKSNPQSWSAILQD